MLQLYLLVLVPFPLSPPRSHLPLQLALHQIALRHVPETLLAGRIRMEMAASGTNLWTNQDVPALEIATKVTWA